jgi:hypothetical protein
MSILTIGGCTLKVLVHCNTSAMAEVKSLSKENSEKVLSLLRVLDRERDMSVLEARLFKAASEGRVDDVSRLSSHLTGYVTLLGQALSEASEHGQLNVVTWLVEHTELRDKRSDLACEVVRACRHGHWNVVKWLVNNAQFDVNYGYTYPNSILHRVISFNPINPLFKTWSKRIDKTEFYRQVFVFGEDFNVQDNENGNTPLHLNFHETTINSYDKIGALLLAGADETIPNDSGETPVQKAVKWGSVTVLSLLDVSSKWKLLVRSHRLRRRTAVRVVMTLVEWKVQQTRSMWIRAILTLHTIMTCTMYTYRHNFHHFNRLYTTRMNMLEF